MHHRYGRHGPRAWLRQRMHRHARSSSLPVPVESPPVASTTIICVFVSATTERIIFIIMQNPEEFDERDEETIPPPDAMQQNLLPQERLDPLIRMIKSLATNDAKLLADTDLRLEDPASKSDLKVIAGYLAHRCVGKDNIIAMMKGSDSSEESTAFITSFTNRYHEIIESGGMRISDGEEESLRERVRTDKERDLKSE